MPIYEFVCSVCKKSKEVLFLLDEKHTATCCGKEMDKKFSLVHIPNLNPSDKYKHELNAEEDTRMAFKSLEERGKLNEFDDREFQPARG